MMRGSLQYSAPVYRPAPLEQLLTPLQTRGGSKHDVLEAVLVALNHVGKTQGELKREVSRMLGREINWGSISRAVKRASAAGCAVYGRTGWTEPEDQLSESRFNLEPVKQYRAASA